jgi:NADH:ubiquinone oxidoreductase subunit 3 (subunit A)
MTFADYWTVLAILTIAIALMSVGAAILHAVGEERLARWLRLPYEQGKDE